MVIEFTEDDRALLRGLIAALGAVAERDTSVEAARGVRPGARPREEAGAGMGAAPQRAEGASAGAKLAGAARPQADGEGVVLPRPPAPSEPIGAVREWPAGRAGAAPVAAPQRPALVPVPADFDAVRWWAGQHGLPGFDGSVEALDGVNAKRLRLGMNPFALVRR